MNDFDPRERRRILQQQVEARVGQQLCALGWASVDGLFQAFAREQRLATLPHAPAAHVRAALALLRYPPELAVALAELLPSLQPPLRYNPFGTTMLAISQLDTLASTNVEQRRRAGELLALVLLNATPSLQWARSVYAGTPFDARIRAELDRALHQYDARRAAAIITLNPPPRPWSELAWFGRLHPAVALAFMAKYLTGVLTPPFVDAGLGAYLGHLHHGDWATGWFWGLTIGIGVAVLLQQLRYRPMLRRLAAE